MTIEEFWNQAFLAALTRLPVKQAKREADEATQACIDHWHANCFNYSPENSPLVQDVDIARAYQPGNGRGGAIPGAFGLKQHTPTPRRATTPAKTRSRTRGA